VEVVSTANTFFQGGVLQINSHTKEKASMPEVSREKGEGPKEAKR
jgi:hypothetical protein